MAELGVDQQAGFGFVEMKVGGGLGGGGDHGGDRFRWLGGGGFLFGGEALLEAGFFSFGFAGQAFPKGLLVFCCPQFGLHRVELPGFLVMGGLILGQFVGEGFQLGAEFLRLVRRCLRRDEGAGFEIRVLECAVEPDADLPNDLKHRQSGAVVARQRVVGGISRAADFAEELVDLVGEDAVVAQAAEEFELAVFRAIEDADVRRYELCEDFGQLPKFQETGIRIFGEIAFCEHPQSEELLIVELQMSEVAAQGSPRFHDGGGEWRLSKAHNSSSELEGLF